jgi:hypothetical protein
VGNDGNKLNFIMPQTMHYLVCHFISQTCNSSSTIEKKKMISYNQQHRTTSMNKQTLIKHPTILCRWKIVDLILATKKQYWEKNPRRGLLLVMGSSHIILG